MFSGRIAGSVRGVKIREGAKVKTLAWRRCWRGGVNGAKIGRKTRGRCSALGKEKMVGWVTGEVDVRGGGPDMYL